mgnify:CR=1 FL=1|tara:strand:- start:443 stop:1069 length:627 start_codon:yes stop_codon:yes gene_type:complete
MKQSDTLRVSGHLEIYKVYENGEEEQVFDEANTITSGMGVGLGLLYAGSGAADITNFQLRYFQIGVGGDERVDNYGVSESLLVSALGQDEGVLDYSSSPDSDIPLASHNLMKWDGSVKATDAGSNTWIFPMISDNGIKRVDLNSVTYILYVDRNSCNNLKEPLNEVGLFMKNPLGTTPYRSQLCAYRPFTDIAKSDDFALVFKWTLNF